MDHGPASETERLLVALETSGPVGSVAAALDGRVVAEDHFERGMRHGRELVPHLAAMCRDLGRGPSTIQVVAVSVGPGSYTGLRVGVTCAKTLAFATGASLVPVSTLETLAQNALRVSNVECQVSSTDFELQSSPDTRHSTLDTRHSGVAVVTDASRGQVCAAFFRREAQGLVRLTDDLLLDPADFCARLTPGTLVLGDAIPPYAAVLEAAAGRIAGLRLADPALAVAHARHVATLGWRDFRAGRTVPAHDLTPVYLRRPEAIDRLLRRQGKA